MNEFATFFHKLQRKRVEAPESKLFNFENSSKLLPKRKTFEIINDLIPFFVEEVKNYIDFTVKPLSKTSPDYEEFKNDPKAPLLNYFTHIIKDIECEWSAIPGAIVLLERLNHITHGTKLSINNMHRVILIAICTADKFFNDSPVANTIIADAGGFNSRLFLEIESEFLQTLQFQIYISRKEIEDILLKWRIQLPE